MQLMQKIQIILEYKMPRILSISINTQLLDHQIDINFYHLKEPSKYDDNSFNFFEKINLTNQFDNFKDLIKEFESTSTSKEFNIYRYELASFNYYQLFEYFQNLDYTEVIDRIYNKSLIGFDLKIKNSIIFRSFQKEALQKWQKNNKKGVCELPTGAGKSILGCMAIASCNVKTLIIVPTIDLVMQWAKTIENIFDWTNLDLSINASNSNSNSKINSNSKNSKNNINSSILGIWTGKEKRLGFITITTYDSALLFSEKFADRFALVIYDECHHLPAISYSKISNNLLSRHKLGLSATLKRSDERHLILDHLIGKVVYRLSILELPENTISNYVLIQKFIDLHPNEKQVYDYHRKKYLDYLRSKNIPNFNWSSFYAQAQRSSKGFSAMISYKIQKKIATCSQAKIEALWTILCQHRKEKIIIFTENNYLAYKIGIIYYLCVITHHTKLKERKAMLANFASNKLNCIVTSKIFNEGIDIPDASVGVVISGTSSVREHVQRLGRILRFSHNKKAKLYELISKNTAEVNTHLKRTKHAAYQKSY